MDKFDEMARQLGKQAIQQGAYRQADALRLRAHDARLAAALRETDAKADARGREKERYRVAMIANAAARAIREGGYPEPEAGGEACGPIADEDGCCSSCGRGLDPCPACQGCDDA